MQFGTTLPVRAGATNTAPVVRMRMRSLVPAYHHHFASTVPICRQAGTSSGVLAITECKALDSGPISRIQTIP